jgi:hypothetical protein
MVALTRTVAEILRRHDVTEALIGQLLTDAKRRMSAQAAIDIEAVAA